MTLTHQSQACAVGIHGSTGGASGSPIEVNKMIDWKDKTRPIRLKNDSRYEVEIFAEVDGCYWGRARAGEGSFWYGAHFRTDELIQEPKTIQYMYYADVHRGLSGFYLRANALSLDCRSYPVIAKSVPINFTITGNKGVIHGEFEVQPTEPANDLGARPSFDVRPPAAPADQEPK